MPWTIYKYILREMLKLLVLSAGVLVVVISFAAAVRPLSEGLLGPWALMKFVAYTAPTMLGFALPFAGAFAATLVFLRMAGDNEVTACSASGISYAMILLPVTVLGLVLTMGLFFMSNHVIPWFYREATRIVEQDLVTTIVRQLDKRRPYVLNREGYVIYADRANEVKLRPGDAPAAAARAGTTPVADQAIILEGVALGVLDREGRIRSDVTAQRAELVVLRDARSGVSWVNMKFHEVMYYDDATGELIYTRLYDPQESIRIPSPFEDQVEFLSWPQLRDLRADPQRYDDVQRFTRQLADVLAAEGLLQQAQRALAASPQRVLTLIGAREGERFLIRAPRVVRRGGALLLTAQGDRPVTLESERAGQVERRYEAQRVTMEVDEQALGDEPVLRVMLWEGVRVYDARRPGTVAEHPEYPMPRMTWPARVLGEPPGEVSMDEALAISVSEPYRDVRSVRIAQRRLERARYELQGRITAQLHSRAATAIACTLLLLLGAVLSMKLRDQMALVVYFWSFLLAIVTLVIVHTGNNMVNSGSSLAGSLGVMWAGNVILAVVVGWSYCVLARN